MTDRPAIDPAAFIERCRCAQRRGSFATVVASTAPNIPAGSRLALHPGGYIESDIADGMVAARIAHDARGAVATGRSIARRYGTRTGAIDVQIDAIVPPPRLFVFGGGELAALVFEAARSTGWEPYACSHFTSQVEHTALIQGSDRAAAIVIASGDALDAMLCEALLATRIRYVGVAGPRHRIQPLVEQLERATGDTRIQAPLHADLTVEPARIVANALVADAYGVITGAVSLRPSQWRAVMPPVAEAGTAA